MRLTKQGLPDLNYYGPRRTPAAAPAVTPAPGSDLEVVAAVKETPAVPTATPSAV